MISIVAYPPKEENTTPSASASSPTTKAPAASSIVLKEVDLLNPHNVSRFVSYDCLTNEIELLENCQKTEKNPMQLMDTKNQVRRLLAMQSYGCCTYYTKFTSLCILLDHGFARGTNPARI